MLYREGPHILHSGRESFWKIIEENLSRGDLDIFAKQTYQLVGPFSEVFPIPRGGTRFAQSLKKLINPEAEILGQSSPLVLVVDDVLTTGETIYRQMMSLQQRMPDKVVKGVVLFARGHIPKDVAAIWTLHPHLWQT